MNEFDVGILEYQFRTLSLSKRQHASPAITLEQTVLANTLISANQIRDICASVTNR